MLTTAELAIALIAFTNIVVALHQIGGGHLNDFQLLVVKLFSVCGFCATFFALLPILLIYFGIHETLLWRIANPVLGASVLWINVWYFHHRKRVAPDRPYQIANYLTSTILAVALILLALGTFRIYFIGSIAPYAFTLVGLLVASAAAFLNTLADFLHVPT